MIINSVKNEILFWDVFRSVVIRNHIFNEMKSMKYEFKSLEECHIKNRIELNKVRSLGWYLKRNEIKLLKDRLLHTNCSGGDNSYYLLIKNSCINKLMMYCKEDMELIELIYEKCRAQMDEYDLLYYSSINKNHNALEYLIKQYPSLIDARPKSLQHVIVNCNLTCLKYLYETVGRSKVVSVLKDFLKNYDNQRYSLDQEVCEYLVEIVIFRHEQMEEPPFINLNTYLIFNDQFAKYLLNLNLVYTNLSNINKRIGQNESNNHILTLFYNKYINYQNLCTGNGKIKNIHDYLQLESSNEKEFKLENYPNIKKYIYSNFVDVGNTFEDIESLIEINKATFDISYFKKLIFDFFSNDKNHKRVDNDDETIQKYFIQLKIMIKYQNYSSDGRGGSDTLETNSNNWWEMELMPFNKFSNDQILELVDFIKSLYSTSEEQYKISMNKLFCVLFPGTKKFRFPECLNSFSNALKLYEIFKNIKLFLNCIPYIIYDIDTESMKIIVDLLNNEEYGKDDENDIIIELFADHCLLDFQVLYNSNPNCTSSTTTTSENNKDEFDQNLIEFLEIIFKIKFYSDNFSNFSLKNCLLNAIHDIFTLVYRNSNAIKIINLIKSSFFENDKEIEQLIEILSDSIDYHTELTVNQDFSLIQYLYQEFPNCFNYTTTLSVLNCYYTQQDGENSDINCNHPFFKMLVNNVISFCRTTGGIDGDGNKEIIQVLEKVVKLNYLPFLKFMVNQLNQEIKECKMVSDNFGFEPNDLSSWFLENCGHLVSVNILDKLIVNDILGNIYKFPLVEIIYTYFKSKNIQIRKNDKIFQHKYLEKYNCTLFDMLIESIKLFRFYIQSYYDLNIDFGFQEIPLFNQLLSNYHSNQITNNHDDDDDIFKLIDIIKNNQKEKKEKIQKEIEERNKEIEERYKNKDNEERYQKYSLKKQKTDNADHQLEFNKQIINQKIKECINKNQLYKLVTMGEFKLAIQLYSNLKLKQPQYNKAYDNYKANKNNLKKNAKNSLKTYIEPFKEFKSIIKYQELEIVLGVFEMTSKYYGPFICNQIVNWSLLYNRIDIYNHFKSLHNDNQINYGNYKYKHGVVTIGFLSKLIHPNYFDKFIDRRDLPMFKFVLNEYLDHHHNTTQLLTEDHKNKLINHLYTICKDKSAETIFELNHCNLISNYLSTTFPQYINNNNNNNNNEKSTTINHEMEWSDSDDEEDRDRNYSNSEFYDFNISCKYFDYENGVDEYEEEVEYKNYN